MERGPFTDIPQSKIMATNFFIQAGYPQSLSVSDRSDENMSDAVQTVFRADTERAILAWNRIYVPLDYKYDLSLMVDDIVDLIEQLNNHTSGHQSVHWPSNTFSSEWALTWADDTLEIHSRWACVIGGTVDLLNKNCKLELAKAEFMAEWRRPLNKIACALESAGYDNAQIAGFDRLKNVVAMLPRPGRLYDK